MVEIPRATVEPNPDAQFAQMLTDLWTAVRALQKGAPIRNASISGGEGMSIVDEATGNTVVQLLPDGTVVTFTAAGDPVVRMGRMVETGDTGDDYGIEVKVGENWIQLGTSVVDWENVGNKPNVFTPANHQHFGKDVVDAVANATRAVSAATADQADGVTPGAFSRVVGGVVGEWHAMYMHSNGLIGRGSSGEQYKQNVRPWSPEDPEGILDLEPVIFDRKAEGGDPFTPPVHTDELGLIAQQVEKVDPQLVVRFQGEVDNVNWNLLPVAMIPLLRQYREKFQSQEKRIEQLESMVRHLVESPTERN